MLLTPRTFSPPLTARLAVIAVAFGTALALLGLDFAPLPAGLIALLAVAGAVEVSCRLTEPDPAPKTRLAVVVVIVVFIVRLLAVGFPPAPVLVAVLGGAAVLTAVARRLTGAVYRLPKLSIT